MMSSAEKICEELGAARNWVILIHERPDGDAVGCGGAMARRADILGKKWTWHGPDPLPETYRFIYGTEQYRQVASLPLSEYGSDTVLVVLDTSSADRTVPLEGGGNSLPKVINIDHHGDNDHFGDWNLVCPEAPATAEPLWNLYEYARWEPDIMEAEALYVALVTDAGHFRFEGTTGRTLRIAAELVDRGVRPNELYSLLYENRSIQGLHLWGRAFSRAESLAGGKACFTFIEKTDFVETGAEKDETEHLVNELLALEGVRIAVLLVEEESDLVRVSIRTKDPCNARELARVFGGGGHIRAAGCRIAGNVKEAVDAVRRELEENDGKRFCSCR